MQLVLKLLSSVSIKRKKPWPKLSWIGQEQDGLYILDGKRVSQLYIPSGKTKKKISKLHGLMNDVCALNVSQNGQFLCGALCDGKIFLWDRDNDKVQFITGLPKVFNDADKGNTKNRIFFSPCGNMMLLMMGFEKLFLWQKIEKHDSDDSHNIVGTWSQVHHGEYPLPDQSNKEATVDGVFYSDEVVGRCGAFSYVFNKGTELAITTLIVQSCDERNVSNLAHNIPNQDEETTSREVVENVKCSIKWKSITRPLYGITSATRLVKGRFVYVCCYSPDGQMLAIVLNQKLAKNTRLLFCSTLHSTSCIVDMKCCGGSDLSSGRTWWVSDLAWTTDSLLLIGITRNGALFITTKVGEPIKLITTGYGMDLGPSLFLSLHPRISVKSFQENIPPDNSEISSGSEKDIFHQKFSVAVHSSQPLVLCSDGYMVTIFHFNSKPDYSKLITDLTKDVSCFLSSDATLQELEQTSGNLTGHGVSAVTPFMAKFGKDVGEYSSPGSTLSETATGFGIARDIEAGVISFGEIDGNKNSSLKIEEMDVQQRLLKAECILLQALGIGTSCGRHWSQNMTVTMNLLIHTWAKLFTILLDNESNCGLSNNDALFHNIITFVQSCFEAFRWDTVYQHCLPWFTQFAHSTVKCLVSSKKFGFREIIDVCMKLLRMAEVFLHEIYAWSAVSNCSTVHFLGDSVSPSCHTHVVNRALNYEDESNDPARYINLDCKLDQSWLTLYHYVCKMYKSNLKTGRREKHTPDEELVQILCLIQRKLQTMNTSRNLVAGNKMESLSDQGYKMYLDGKYSQATDLLERSFHENSKETKYLVTPLELNLSGASGRALVSRFGASLIEDDLSSKLSTDIDTLLSILYINLENYDLKAALALVYSFIDTTRDVSLQNLLETTHERNQTLIPADDSEVKITSSSSLKVLQLSVLVKYPLAWVVDNRAISIVQQLARFMACYFTNLPLIIPTPFHSQTSLRFVQEFNKDNIPKAHASAVKNLSQRRLTGVIGQQKLESVWTADHTMELLLISGLLGEAAWFAKCLGDWKIAFLLSVTEEFRQKNQSYVEKKSHDRATMPIEVPEAEQLMKERINIVLKLDEIMTETDVEGTREIFDDERICSLQNVLEASVITELNLVPGIIKQLLVMLKMSISKLDWMVPQDLYLPAPPLYCPQPARNDGDVLNEETRKEISLRTEIAIIVQKILAMYKASSCFLYCAQEYCKHVIRNWSDSQTLPNIINELITTEGIRINTPEDEYSGVIRSFHEFCSLMWLLDVRNELALTSRRYSKLKQNLSAVPNDEQRQEVVNQCEDALVWLQRLLPFSDFLNATEDVLDGILTMLSELPLNGDIVDLLARYFHTPSPLLSIPTTDKLNRMTRKIRNKAEGLENGESLTVRFQQQCEKRRTEKNKISVQPFENHFLEVIPEFCRSLDYQHDFAFLRFLDTFLLITLAKNITSDDYKKAPLILPYKDKPTLEAELSSIEETTTRKGKISRKTSFGIQRSQSFQDVGNIKKKPGSSLLSPDDLDSDKPIDRSNSLTDLRRVQSSTFSQELQAFLPTLLWLKRWCLIEEHQKGNQSVNKSYSLLNMTTTPTAIRVRLPLKLVVNTLWLIENYYKDFAEAKGKCLRDKRSRMKKKRKKRYVKKEIEEDILVEEVKQKQDGEPPLEAEVEEENRNVDARVGESRGLESKKKAGGERSLAAEVEEENRNVDARVGESRGLESKKKAGGERSLAAEVEEENRNVDARVGESRGLESKKKAGGERSLAAELGEENGKISEAEVGKSEPQGVVGEENRRVDEGGESVGKRQLQVYEKEKRRRKRGAKDSKQKVQTGDQLETTKTELLARQGLGMEESGNEIRENMEGIKVEIKTRRRVDESERMKVQLPEQKMRKRKEKNLNVSRGYKEGDLGSQKIPDISVEHRTFLGERTNESEGSIIKPHKYLNEIVSNGSQMNAPVSSQTDEGEVRHQNFNVRSSVENISRIKKNLFSSPTSSSVGSKWKSLESVDADIPLFSFTHLDDGNTASDEKITNVLSRVVSESDVSDVVMVGIHSRVFHDYDVSLTSESLSIGQIRSDVAFQMNVAANVDSDASVANKRNDKQMKRRTAARRKIYDESSSCESLDKPRVKPKDDGGLLRRIIRSEMRKFVKTQQAEIRSQSSTAVRTTDENLSDEVSKSKGGKSQVKRKSSQEPPMSYRKNRIKTNEDFMDRSSEPFRDSQTPSARTGRQPMNDQGTCYQPPTNEDDTSTSCPRSDHQERGHVATTATKHHDNVQNPPQVFPPMVSQLQFPTVSGWPMWYNPTFPSAPPPWLWPNTTSRQNSDKGTQVEEADHVIETNEAKTSSLIEINEAKMPSVADPIANNGDGVHDEIKDKTVSVAIQTDICEKIETSAKIDRVHQESTHGKEDVPFLLSLSDQMNVRDENQGRENMPENAKHKRPANRHASNTSDDQEEFSQHHDVFAKNLSTERNARDPEINSASTFDDPFAIPLLKFPTEVHNPTLQSLPFKIAWPEHVQPNEQVELPLLQLGDELSKETECPSFPLPLTGHSAPLLHFSNQNNEDGNLSDFHFVQVPENEDFHFPLLYLPKTGIEPPEFYSEFQSRYGGDTEKEKPGRKREQNGISRDTNFVSEVGVTSTARMKRRNELAGNVVIRETAMKPNQHRQPISKQTSSNSPFSEREERHGTQVTVQPAPGKDRSKKNNAKNKKTKPRRDKLKELNNIIRDLQRDLTNDDDLVISEVSSLLSPEIRYENFEKKPEVKKQSKHESQRTRKLPTASLNVSKERERRSDQYDDIEEKPTPVPRLYKPTTISARDIHTEIPSDIPEQSIPVDVKVGTDNIIRFPVSVQTDTVLPEDNEQPPSSQRVEPRERSVQTRRLGVQTKEFSIQTEPEIKNVPARSVMRDVAINTENVVEKREAESKSAISLYPRVPVDVYLDIQDIDQKPTETTSSNRDPPMREQRNGARFLSVVDIAEDDVRRQIRDKPVKENKDKDYRKNEDIPFDEDPDIMKSGSRAMSSTAEENLPDDVENGDHTTVAVFQRPSLNQPRGNSLQQAQKMSKEKLSQRLHEMNEQFDAIEQLTSNMEQDLQRSNRLLRTIENLNKITDHKSEVDKRKKSVGPRVEDAIEKQTHNVAVAGRVRQLPNTVDIQHGNLNEEMSARRETEYNVLQEDKLSVLKRRPWINKPIEELTDLVSDDRTEERSLDSLENSREKNGGNMSGASAQNKSDDVASLGSDVANTEDIRDTEGYRDTMEDIQSRKSSISNGTIKSHVDPEKLVNPETARSDRRLKLSLTPEDILNVSRENLKEILAGTTTPNVSNTRSRDITPQKQQELREWMSKKRKLRHKEWTQKQNEKRGTEFKPFQNKKQGEQTAMSSKKLKKSEKEREDNRRTQKKEHVDERLLSAYDLINEMVTEHAPNGPALITQNSVRNSQRKASKKTARVKANNRYKENRVMNSRRKKPSGKTVSKAPTELYSTRTIPGQTGLTGLSSLVGSGRERNSDAPVYDYDIEESARQFITRKSFENYQQKMSASFDFERSISLRSPFQYSVDPRVDELLEDVSLGDPLDLQRFDHLDSLLSGDSELRDLLGDVISDKPSRDLLETRDDVMSRNSRISRNVESRWRGPSPVESERKVLDTFKMDRKENNRVKDYHQRYPQDILSANEDGNLEMSDEVAALLAEAKAAVGDDFSGTSEVGDIDWNEVDEVLQHN